MLLSLLVGSGVSSTARAEDVQGDQSVPSTQLGVYATVGGILGSTGHDHREFGGNDSAVNLSGTLDGVQRGGLVIGAAVGGIFGLSSRFDLQSRLGFLYQLSGDFEPYDHGCRLSGGNCHYEWDSTPSSRSLFYLEATARYRPFVQSTFYTGLGARLGVTSTTVTFNGTLIDHMPSGPPLLIHESRADRYFLAGAIAEIGMVFGPIDLGLRGGATLLTTEDAAATLELTAGWRLP